jgi:hypothetical protein
MSQRKKYDVTQPGAKALADSIVHGAAITEGTMVAFPTCFPNVTVPVRADESRITAMDVTPGGIVYAGTSGYASHLLVGMFHGITGMVFDMGSVEGGSDCTAICCGEKSIVAAVNGPSGGQLVKRPLQPLPFDLIQEWHIERQPYHYQSAGGKILHAVTDAQHANVIGVTVNDLFTFNIENAELKRVGEVAGSARIARGSAGNIFGRDGAEHLWRYDPRANRIERKALPLPKADWSNAQLLWARDEADGSLYTIDARGALYRFSEQTGFSAALGTIPQSPIGAMAVTRDGRLFVSAGDGIARLFTYEPAGGRIADLGVAVSVIERRRYGYCFGDAVLGRDGEIIFGENDDLGHLWLYFPRIAARK